MTISIWLVCGPVLSYGAPLSGVVFLLLVLALWLPVYARFPRLQRWLACALPTGIREGLYMGSAVLLIYAALLQGRIIVGSPATVTMLGNVLEPTAFYALFSILAAMGAYAAGYAGMAGLIGVIMASAAAWAGGFLAVPASYVGILPLSIPLAVPLDVPAEPVVWMALPVLILTAAVFYTPARSSVEGEAAICRVDAFAPRVSGRRIADIVCTLFFLLFFYPVMESIASFPALLTGVLLLVGVRAMEGAGIAWRPAFDVSGARAAFLVGSICLPLSFSLMTGLSLMYITYAGVALLGGERQNVAGVVYGLAFLSLVAWMIMAP